MATSKKPPTKTTKTTPNKTTARKATTAKKAPVKSRAASTRKPKTVEQQSFRACPPVEPFLTFRINRQTAYWLVLGCIVILLAAWILKLQSDIEYIYDQIEVSNSQREAAEAELELRAKQES